MKKYTTEALKSNQYLEFESGCMNSYLESYMIGFTDNMRDNTLDGVYINSQITPLGYEIVRVLSNGMNAAVTYWKAESENGKEKCYKRTACKTPYLALKRAKKVFTGQITISGLTEHAETKPLLIG